MIELTIVIPIYNEEKILPALCQQLEESLPRIKDALTDQDKGPPQVEILFINDGSSDKSLNILESIAVKDNNYRFISLSRNFGHQAAVAAGLYSARGEMVVVMDGDLQDPPELIVDMIKKCREGYDVVYAVRRRRKAGFFHKISYKIYYLLNSLISDYPIQRDAGDFSLLHRKVVDIINKLPEGEIYMRGLRAWVGFKQVALPYDRENRKIGKSKYSFGSLAKLAFRGILSTSTKPLLISGVFSVISLLIVMIIILYVLSSKIFLRLNSIPAGWASIMMTISILSGFQLLSLWILSLYVAKMYREILSRPTYIIANDSLKEKQTNKD